MTELKLEFKKEDGTTRKFNKGKSFVLPNWTVIKHKKVLEEINKLPKDTREGNKDIEFQFLCVYEGLKGIDPDLTLEEIRNTHPSVIVELFNVVYSEGKYDIYFRNKGKQKKSK